MYYASPRGRGIPIDLLCDTLLATALLFSLHFQLSHLTVGNEGRMLYVKIPIFANSLNSTNDNRGLLPEITISGAQYLENMPFKDLLTVCDVALLMLSISIKLL